MLVAGRVPIDRRRTWVALAVAVPARVERLLWWHRINLRLVEYPITDNQPCAKAKYAADDRTRGATNHTANRRTCARRRVEAERIGVAQRIPIDIGVNVDPPSHTQDFH